MSNVANVDLAKIREQIDHYIKHYDGSGPTYVLRSARAGLTWLERDLTDARSALREIDSALGGDPNAPVVQKVLGRLESAAISDDDICRLSRIFCDVSDLRTEQDVRINEWLKRRISEARGFQKAKG